MTQGQKDEVLSPSSLSVVPRLSELGAASTMEMVSLPLFLLLSLAYTCVTPAKLCGWRHQEGGHQEGGHQEGRHQEEGHQEGRHQEEGHQEEGRSDAHR